MVENPVGTIRGDDTLESRLLFATEIFHRVCPDLTVEELGKKLNEHTSKTSEEVKWMSIKDLANHLAISEKTIRRRIKEALRHRAQLESKGIAPEEIKDIFRFMRIGSQWRIVYNSFVRYYEKSKSLS